MHVSPSGGTVPVDIIPTDGGKGRGIEKMLKYYHFDKSQAMAFGDGKQ